MKCCVTWGLGDGEVIDGLELHLQDVVRIGVSEATSDEPSVTQHRSHSSGVGHLWHGHLILVKGLSLVLLTFLRPDSSA